MATDLSIGDLSAATGERVRTLRYWTDRGLLPAARAENAYRRYGPGAAGRVAFIREAQALGFTLEGVARLLAVADERRDPCHRVEGELEARLAEVRAGIAALQATESELVSRLAGAAERPCDEAEGCRFLPRAAA